MILLVHNVQWALSTPQPQQPVHHVLKENIDIQLQLPSATLARQENIPRVAWMHALGVLKANFQTHLVLVGAQRAREENISHMNKQQLA